MSLLRDVDVGYVVENAIISLPYGSRQIMEALRSKLTESSDYSFMSSVESLLLRYAMEQVGRQCILMCKFGSINIRIIYNAPSDFR